MKSKTIKHSYTIAIPQKICLNSLRNAGISTTFFLVVQKRVEVLSQLVVVAMGYACATL